jgi:hypothetical protein
MKFTLEVNLESICVPLKIVFIPTLSMIKEFHSDWTSHSLMYDLYIQKKFWTPIFAHLNIWSSMTTQHSNCDIIQNCSHHLYHNYLQILMSELNPNSNLNPFNCSFYSWSTDSVASHKFLQKAFDMPYHNVIKLLIKLKLYPVLPGVRGRLLKRNYIQFLCILPLSVQCCC